MEGTELELFARSLRHAVENNSGQSLDRALEEAGWNDALELDRRASISILFELLGSANVTSNSLNQVLVAGMGAGVTAGMVVLPALGDWRPSGRPRGDRVVVSGLGLGCATTRQPLMVVVADGETERAVQVPRDSLTSRPVEGMDPELGLVEITGEFRPGEAEVVDWNSAVALGQLAISHELVGASRRMLDLAREHALNRIQFGRPISRFQAVRHRLADALVAIETADAMVDGAWTELTALTAAIAKAVAGRGASITARHCQQVLAGIGFTAEHPLHRYVRRVLVLDQLLGASRVLTAELGRDLLATKRLPALLAL
jgi:hypothetical protein